MSDTTAARTSENKDENTVEEKTGHDANAPEASVDEVVADSGHNEATPVADQDATEWEHQLQQARADKERVQGLYTRLLADYENYRRRTNEEITVIRQTAAADLGERLLPVIDNLERAIDSAGDEDGPFVDGVRLVLRQFLQALQASGIEPIVSEGQPFDPAFHEAVDSVPAASDEERGTVVAEMQKGYILGERVLRPALVRVAN